MRYNSAIALKMIKEFENHFGAEKLKWREEYLGQAGKGKPIALYKTIIFSNYKIRGGQNRISLIPKKGNFIIKINRYDDYDDCKEEAQIYRQAQKEGLEHYFAKILDVITYNNKEWYVYEKVPFVGEPYKFSKRTFNNERLESYIYDEGLEFEGAYAYLSDGSKAMKLVDFLINKGINDLHMENFGWSNRLRHIVIIDYANVS